MVVRGCGPSYSGDWDRKLTWDQEFEAIESHDCTTTVQTEWQTETLSQNKTKTAQANGFSASSFPYEGSVSSKTYLNCYACFLLISLAV